jgi:hypothetical protein
LGGLRVCADLGWLSIQFAGTVTDAKAEKHADERIETSPA